MIHIHNDGEPMTMEQREGLAKILAKYLEMLEAEEAEEEAEGS